jgi:16S rRNA (cytidine1402-2'-O)-methyltransferase
VACEDTRRTGRLFQLLGLTAPRLVRLDDHAEAAEAPRLVARAAAGETVAVVSDAGLPGLSDPGGRTVALAAARSAWRSGATARSTVRSDTVSWCSRSSAWRTTLALQ